MYLNKNVDLASYLFVSATLHLGVLKIASILQVQAAPVAKLAKEDRQALFDLTKKCCRGVQSVLCQTM